jgi:hypothetical protein
MKYLKGSYKRHVSFMLSPVLFVVFTQSVDTHSCMFWVPVRCSVLLICRHFEVKPLLIYRLEGTIPEFTCKDLIKPGKNNFLSIYILKFLPWKWRQQAPPRSRRLLPITHGTIVRNICILFFFCNARRLCAVSVFLYVSKIWIISEDLQCSILSCNAILEEASSVSEEIYCHCL